MSEATATTTTSSARPGRGRGQNPSLAGRASTSTALPPTPPLTPLPDVTAAPCLSRRRGRGGRGRGGVGPDAPSSTSTSTSKRAETMARLADVESKLATGVYTTKSKQRTTGQAGSAEGDDDVDEQEGGQFSIWDHVDVVIEKATKLEVHAVQCRRCKKCLAYDSKLTGTSSITSHVRRTCSALPHNSRRNQPSDVFVPCPADAKEMAKNKFADICAATMSSMTHLVCPEMAELLQIAVDVGASVGRVDARDMVPAATTIADKLEERATEARAKVTEEVKEAIDDNRCRCTTDMWTDDFSLYNYIDVTAHYTDKNFTKAESSYLFLAKFPTTQEKSAVNIKNALLREMTEMGFTEEQFNKIEWISDRGANIKKALEDSPREDCSAHLINTVGKGITTLTHIELRRKAVQGCEEAQTMLRGVEEAARIVKSVKKNEKLQVGFDVRRLQNAIQLPRPHLGTYVGMLQSITAHRDKVVTILRAKGQDRVVEAVQNEGLQDLIDFLSPLERNGDVPANSYETLQQHLTPRDDDTPLVRNMKASLRQEHLLFPVLKMIKICKDLVTYMKISGYNQHLDERVVQESETRWNSLCGLLESLLRQYDQVATVLTAAKQQARMEGIVREDLDWLVAFLMPFRTQTTKLEGDKYPTLPLVLLASSHLRLHCQPDILDNEWQAAIRERALRLLEEKLQPTMQQKLATFLVPKFSKLLMIETEEREKVYQHARTLVDIMIQEEKEEAQDADDPGSLPAPPPPKRARVDDDEYEAWASEQPQEEVANEVDRYLRLHEAASIGRDQLFEFWRNEGHPKRGRFPHLSKIAKRLLGKPASSAPSERVFSKAGFVMTSRRNRLHPRTMDNILFLHSYLQK